jgi:hypothetical protein
MSDERWISKDERDNEFSNDATNRWHWHAEVADELIAELAEALREFVPCYCMWCENPEYRGPCAEAKAAGAALARVDALTKDTA